LLNKRWSSRRNHWTRCKRQYW